MATSRDDQSARVTEKKLKDVQCVYSAQTQQKGINRMASPISPPRRERARDLVSICHRSASSDRVSIRSLLRVKPLRSYMAHSYSVALRLNSDLPSRFSKPNAATFSTSLLGRGVSFRGRSGSPSPSAVSAESLSHRILPTPLLAPSPLAAEASPAM